MCEFDNSEAEYQPLNDVVFGSLLPGNVKLSGASLLELSRDRRLANPPIETGLTRQVAQAWVVPVSRLTCTQVAMLVVQKFGMKWLAKPVAVFVRANPTAECRYYPGDLAFATLAAHVELLQHAPDETRTWLDGDFDWVPKTFGFTRHFSEEAIALLDEARRVARARTGRRR